MLTFRYARASDVTFIVKTNCATEIRDFVSASSDDVIAASIEDRDQAYLLALRDASIPVGQE